MSNPIDRLLDELDRFLSLKPSQISKGKSVSGKIRELSKEVASLPRNKDLKSEIKDAKLRAGGLISKFHDDVERSQEGALDSEWKKIAENDMKRLKDELRILKSLIEKNAEALTNEFYEKEYGSSFEALLSEIEEFDEFDQVLKSKFRRKVEKTEREKMDQFSSEINRLSRYILRIKEVDCIDR